MIHLPEQRTEDQHGLVLLDASVLEGQYLRPILRGEDCRDVRAIAHAGYHPAVLLKTMAEVWSHARLGSGNSAAWVTEHAGYPGSLDAMVAAIQRASPDVEGARETAWLWFNLSEEWRGRDVLWLARTPLRRDFFTWKEAMEKFCLDVQAHLEAHGIVVTVPARTCVVANQAAELELELALHSLLPSEDAAWILDAILVRARAIVTTDAGVIGRGRLSLGFNVAAPSVVHPTRLREALADDFGEAWYPTAAEDPR